MWEIHESIGVPASGIGLNSWCFLLLGVAAVLLARSIADPRARRVLLLSLNVVFVVSYLRTPRSALVLTGFLAITWGLGELKARLGARWPVLAQVGVVVGLWVFMFFVRDPGLVPALNPFSWLPVQIVGVSYLAFRGISYVMEVELVEERSPFAFLNYMLFFPTLLAGPIERYRRFVAAQDGAKATGPEHILPALHRIADGLILKYVLADNLQLFGVFSVGHLADVEPLTLWVGTLLQMFIIYLDFAGYCHVALGLAELMGIPIVENFNRPFAATNMQAFWERWHISLSSMVKDYVFTPAMKQVFKRLGKAAQAPALLAVYFGSMVLIGVWHGTTWGFLVYGLMHATALVAWQWKKANRKKLPHIEALSSGRGKRIATVVAAVGTYVFVCLSLVPWVGEPDNWLNLFRILFVGGPA